MTDHLSWGEFVAIHIFEDSLVAEAMGRGDLSEVVDSCSLQEMWRGGDSTSHLVLFIVPNGWG